MWQREPDPLARVPSPLYCQLPFDTPPGKDVIVRCLTQKKQKRSAATFHYRPRGAEGEFAGIAMVRSPKGWLTALVPGRAIRGKSLSYYVTAEIPGMEGPLFLGHPEAPRELIIRKQPGSEAGGDTDESSDLSAMRDDVFASATDKSQSPTRLRPPGAVWFAVAGGTGAAYHGRQNVDSNAKMPGTSRPVTVQSGFSPATLFQLEPEIGYQVSKRFSLSVLGRYQYAPNDYIAVQGENPIRTSAFAAFARGQFAWFAQGNFQPYSSLGAGVGTSFLAVVSKHCGPAAPCSLDHRDTLHGGPVGLTAGLGALYQISPSFGLLVDIKEITTLPKFLALTEVNVGLVFARKFHKANARQSAGLSKRASWR